MTDLKQRLFVSIRYRMLFTTKRKDFTAMRWILVFFLGLAFFAHEGLAIECPKMPEQTKKNWDVQVEAAVGKIGLIKGTELKTRTRAITIDLMGKLPNADTTYLYQMMYATYCSSLKGDKTLSETEKGKRIKTYNAELTRALAEAKKN